MKLAQLCPSLCNPVDCSLPGSTVHGILQARILEWVAISFPGDLPNPGIKPGSPTLQADALLSEPPGKPGPGRACIRWVRTVSDSEKQELELSDKKWKQGLQKQSWMLK